VNIQNKLEGAQRRWETVPALCSSLSALARSRARPFNRWKAMNSDMAAYPKASKLETPRPHGRLLHNDGIAIILSHWRATLQGRVGPPTLTAWLFARQEFFLVHSACQRDHRVSTSRGNPNDRPISAGDARETGRVSAALLRL